MAQRDPSSAAVEGDGTSDPGLIEEEARTRQFVSVFENLLSSNLGAQAKPVAHETSYEAYVRSSAPVMAQRAIVDFDRLREVLVFFRDMIFRELHKGTEEQQTACRLALGDVLTRFDGAVANAHRALERWNAGEIGDVALCTVAAEPAHILEEATTDVWRAVATK